MSTGSRHEYTATLLVGGDEYPLGIRRAGSIVLDEGSAPHVTGELELALPDEALQLLLDPRVNARVRIDAHAAFPTTVQDRSFNLCLRSRPIRRGRDAQASVSLASDEKLLGDWRAQTDDRSPLALAGSLRAVINYALAAAIPGAALAASPAVDADVTPFWRVTNLHKNSVPRTAITGYVAGFGVSGVARSTSVLWNALPTVQFTAATTGEAYVNTPTTAISVRPGESYTHHFQLLSVSTGRPTRIMIRWKDAAGTILRTDYTTAVTSSPSVWTRYRFTGEAPPNATTMEAFINVVSNAAGQNHFASGFMTYPGTELIDWFDGAAIRAGYTVAYDTPTDPTASTSTRTPYPLERPLESLIWPAGVSALEFLHPLVQAAGYRLVCDETRTWMLRDENYTAPGSVTIREGVNLIEGADVIDRDAGLWFDAQVTIYEWDDAAGVRQRRVDSFVLNDPPTLVNTVTVNAPYAGPGRSEYAVRRAQGRGREVTATTVADWRARAEQPVTIRLQDAPIQTGQTSRIEFDLSTDRMTTTTRTTDTPALAWVLIPEGESWLDSPVGESWIEEVA